MKKKEKTHYAQFGSDKTGPVAIYQDGEVLVRADGFLALTCSRVVMRGRHMFVPPEDIRDCFSTPDQIAAFDRNLAEWAQRGAELMGDVNATHTNVNEDSVDDS